MIPTLLIGAVCGANTTAPPQTTVATTTLPGTTPADQWNVVCNTSSGTTWCKTKQDAWANCSCDGDKLVCTGKEAAKCMPKGQYDCACKSGPPPEKCTEEYNMGCNPAKADFVKCCPGLECQTDSYDAGQCKRADPDKPSDNPYAPVKISEQGWHVGCTSEFNTKAGCTQFFYKTADKLVDGKKVDIKQFIKGGEDAKDLSMGVCTKECKADGDCPTLKGSTSKCVEVSTGLKICANVDKCASGEVTTDKICVSKNPYAIAKNQLNYKTYFPVPNSTHHDYHSPHWDMQKDLKDYLPLHLSNWIGGIHLGQMLKKHWKWPLESIKKEYIYGTLMGQLFQESSPSDNPKDIQNDIINPDKKLLNVGQGGPYQLNDYSKQMPPLTEGAYGELNYNALYHALGYTVAEQGDIQTGKRGPKVLNSVNHGPMIAAYFHFNDINRYNLMNSQPSTKDSDKAKYWRQCKANIEAGKFKNPDIMLNVIYNAGPYADYAQMVFELCAGVDKYTQELKDLQDYSLDDQQYCDKFQKFDKKPSPSTTYIIYPRQINFYIDQFISDNESLYERSGAFSDIDVPFTLQDVVDQFQKTFTGIGYKSKEGLYELIDDAFLQRTQPKGDLAKKLSFSNKADRAEFFTFVEQWIQALEDDQGFKFSDATECDQKVGEKVVEECKPPSPICDKNFPKDWHNLCSCVEDKDTHHLEMKCVDPKNVEKFKKQYHCTCDQPTGTTTVAPTPQKGDACDAQNCAEGLACIANVWVDSKQINSEFRYGNEKPTCQPYEQDPMINHLITKENGKVADGESCTVSKECGQDSVCVQAGVYTDVGQFDAECRSSADSDCKCKKASDSDDQIVKQFLSQKSRRLAIFV